MATLFLIDDNDAVRSMAELALKTLGYRVHSAANGSEALARWPELAASVDVVMTDLSMPGGIDGLELLRRMREERPGLKAIIVTGEQEKRPGERRGESGDVTIHKPYQAAVLDAAIRHLLGNP